MEQRPQELQLATIEKIEIMAGCVWAGWEACVDREDR